MISDPRIQSMAWMETDCSKHTHQSMEADKMATGALGRARKYG